MPPQTGLTAPVLQAASQDWNPIVEAYKRYPGLKGKTVDEVGQFLNNPQNFRQSFPEYAHLSDDVIQRNVGRHATVTQEAAKQPGFWKSLGNVFGVPTTPEQAMQTASTMTTRFAQNPYGFGVIPTGQEAIEAAASVAPKVAREAKETVASAKRGDVVPALAHAGGTLGYGAATLTAPVGGTSLATAGEQFGTGQVRSGMGTTAGLIAPFAVGAFRSEPSMLPKPEHVEALTGLIDSRGGAVDPHETAATALPEARKMAVEMGVKPEQFKGRATGELVTGKKGIFNRAIQAHRAEYAALRKGHLGEMMDTTPIAQAYLDRITPEMIQNDPATVARLRAEAGKFAHLDDAGNITAPKPQTLEMLDNFRERMNRELNTYEKRAVGQQIMSDTEMKAQAAAADAARDSIYKTLGRLTGKGEQYIRDLKGREGALVEARNSLTKEFNQASGAEGVARSKTIREKMSGLYPSRWGVGHQAIRQGLGVKPIESFNIRMRKMFAALPENAGKAPETPVAAPAQPATPAPKPTAPVPAPAQPAAPPAAEQPAPTLTPPVKPTPPSPAPGELGIRMAPARGASPYDVAARPERRGSVRPAAAPVWSEAERTIRRAGLTTDPDTGVNKELGTITFWDKANPNRVAIMRMSDVERGGVEAVKAKMAERTAQGEAKAHKGMPAPVPSPSKTPSSTLRMPQGLSKASQATLIMLAAKDGSITQQDANRRIQKLVGNSGTRTSRLRSPEQ